MFGKKRLQLIETSMTFVCHNRPDDTVVVTNPVLRVAVDDDVMEDWWGNLYSDTDGVVYTEFNCLCGQLHRHVFCSF